MQGGRIHRKVQGIAEAKGGQRCARPYESTGIPRSKLLSDELLIPKVGSTALETVRVPPQPPCCLPFGDITVS